MALITDCGQSALRYELNCGLILFFSFIISAESSRDRIIHATFSY